MLPVAGEEMVSNINDERDVLEIGRSLCDRDDELAEEKGHSHDPREYVLTGRCDGALSANSAANCPNENESSTCHSHSVGSDAHGGTEESVRASRNQRKVIRTCWPQRSSCLRRLFTGTSRLRRRIITTTRQQNAAFIMTANPSAAEEVARAAALVV